MLAAGTPDRGPDPADTSPEEEAFLARYDMRGFDPAAVTVDFVVLTVRDGRLCVLLVRRGSHPHRGCWALPGGFVRSTESLEEAARRELRDETGVDGDAWHLEQLRGYWTPGRDRRGLIVSIAHLALIPDLPLPQAGTDATEAAYWPIEEIAAPADLEAGVPHAAALHLAFDHNRILADGVDRVRSLLETTSIATTFFDRPFTMPELRRVYEAVWGQELHAANFRRKVLATEGFLEATGGKHPTGRGWAELYRAGEAVRLKPALFRPEDESR